MESERLQMFRFDLNSLNRFVSSIKSICSMTPPPLQPSQQRHEYEVRRVGGGDDGGGGEDSNLNEWIFMDFNQIPICSARIDANPMWIDSNITFWFSKSVGWFEFWSIFHWQNSMEVIRFVYDIVWIHFECHEIEITKKINIFSPFTWKFVFSEKKNEN